MTKFLYVFIFTGVSAVIAGISESSMYTQVACGVSSALIFYEAYIKDYFKEDK